MSRLSKRSAKSAASARSGAAFLLLVMMVLLVIVSSTQWLVTNSIANQKGEIDRLRARSMIAAMNRVQAIPSDRQETLRLPVNDETDERIEIFASNDGASLTAIWFRGNTEIARLSRPVNAPPNPSAPTEKQNQDPDKQ